MAARLRATTHLAPDAMAQRSAVRAWPQCGPRVLFAMAYGGNGITYSLLGADIIEALVKRRPHPLARLFSFQRKSA